MKRAKLKRKIDLSSDSVELSSVNVMSAWPNAVSFLKQNMIQGENPVCLLFVVTCTTHVFRVELFGIAALIRW